MTDYFVFPFQFNELLDESTDERYKIQSKDMVKGMEERHILRTLAEIESALHDDLFIILEPDRFDFFYFTIKNVEEKQDKISIDIVDKLSELLISSVDFAIKSIQQENDKQDDNTDINSLRNSFKMLMFLSFYFLQSTCIKKSKSSIKDEINEAIAGTKDDLNSKKKKGKKRELSNDFVQKVLEKQRILLDQIYQTLNINLKFLWPKSDIDEEFFRYYIETSLKMLESSQLLSQKGNQQNNEYGGVRTTIFKILETVLIHNQSSLKNIQIKLINLIYEEETLVDNVIDLILKLYHSEDAQLQQLASDTIILLCNYINSKVNINTESQAVKNTKDFLIKISQEIPKLFYNNLSCFIKLYDNESYYLRNAISEIIGQIIKTVLTRNSQTQDCGGKDEEDEQEEDLVQQEAHMKAKKKLLDTLITRIFDKHAYCRSCVLGVLGDLCSENVVPKDYLMPILKCGCDRMKDASAHVRKKAITLLYMVMKYYRVIFVESQKKTCFLSLQQIENEQQIVEQEKQELANACRNIEMQMQQIENAENFDELQTDLKCLKRKAEQARQLQEHLLEYQAMIENINRITPNLEQLLGSKSIFDVNESIQFLLFLYQNKIESAESGIRKMQVLIWTRDKSIKEELLSCYWSLFLDEKSLGGSKAVSANLIKLFKDATLTERISLEEMLNYFINWNNLEENKGQNEKKLNMFYITRQVFDHLWEAFIQNVEENSSSNSGNIREENKKVMHTAIQILRISSAWQKDILNSNKYVSLIEVLKKFLKSNKPDWVVVKEVAGIVERQGSNLKTEYISFFVKLLLFILIRYQGTQDNQWFCACEKILNMLFTLKNSAENLTKFLIQKCTKNLITSPQDKELLNLSQQQSQQINGQFVFSQPQLQQRQQQQENDNVDISDQHGQMSPNHMMRVTPIKTPDNIIEEVEELQNGRCFERKLGHLLFLVGHAALKVLIYVDSIDNDLKKLKNEGEKKQQIQQQKMDPNQQSSANSELDKICGGLDAEYERKIEQLHEIAENNILNNNLLSFFKSWVVNIVDDLINSKQRERRDVVLDRVAVLTLCKFMCISKAFCQQNLTKLFQLLKLDVDYILKSNIIISLGDLLHKYPNIVEPYTYVLYSNLHDSEVQVRKITMMVLAHLILNDMMKIKGEISEVGLLLEDENIKVQNLVKLFLQELHKKDAKTMYNLLPEAISRMSKYEQTEIGSYFKETSFQTLAKNIMPYLEKQKSDILIEKLIFRITNSTNLIEWKNTAYCLSQLSYNEKGLQKLLDLYENYREKLADPYINDCFRNILGKTKKMVKPEVKQIIEELEVKYNNYSKETFEKRRDPLLSKKKKTLKKNDQEQNVEAQIDMIDENDKENNRQKEQGSNYQKSNQKNNESNLKKKKQQFSQKRNKQSKRDYDDDDDNVDIEEEDQDNNLSQNSESFSFEIKRKGQRLDYDDEDEEDEKQDRNVLRSNRNINQRTIKLRQRKNIRPMMDIEEEDNEEEQEQQHKKMQSDDDYENEQQFVINRNKRVPIKKQ